jgi:hypothetical protein
VAESEVAVMPAPHASTMVSVATDLDHTRDTMEPISISDDVISDDNDFDAALAERLLIHAWRAERLRSLGLSRLLAELFADVVDWRAIADLVDRGCSPQLALEIVR